MKALTSTLKLYVIVQKVPASESGCYSHSPPALHTPVASRPLLNRMMTLILSVKKVVLLQTCNVGWKNGRWCFGLFVPMWCKIHVHNTIILVGTSDLTHHVHVPLFERVISCVEKSSDQCYSVVCAVLICCPPGVAQSVLFHHTLSDGDMRLD